jgi:hypothetical protein
MLLLNLDRPRKKLDTFRGRPRGRTLNRPQSPLQAHEVSISAVFHRGSTRSVDPTLELFSPPIVARRFSPCYTEI